MDSAASGYAPNNSDLSRVLASTPKGAAAAGHRSLSGSRAHSVSPSASRADAISVNDVSMRTGGGPAHGGGASVLGSDRLQKQINM